MEHRVAYGRHWWMLDEDGTILVYDEDEEEWDLWEGNLDDPLPPPEFVGEQRDIELRTPAFRLIKGLTYTFLALAALSLITNTVYAFLWWYGEGSPQQDEFQRLAAVLSDVSNRGWQIAIGCLLAAVGVMVYRYLESKPTHAGSQRKPSG